MDLKEMTLAALSKPTIPMTSVSNGCDVTSAAALGHDSLGAGKRLRRLLRMIATEPAELRAPRPSIRQLRPVVDRARLALQANTNVGTEKYPRGQAHLMDGAVSGLCHIARFCSDDVGDSIIPPFAVAGVGLWTRPRPAPSPFELLFVVPENAVARERAYRMIVFVLAGLADLGLTPSYASSTPNGAPGFVMLTTRDTCFVWGCFSLYADFGRRLAIAPNEPAIQRT